MICCGIDQSTTSTGLFIDKPVPYYQIIGTSKDADDHLDVFTRCAAISDEINTALGIHRPTHVNIEGLGFGAVGNATRNLAILQGVIVCGIMRMHPDIIIDIIAPTALKKFATGDGKASKEGMYTALPEEIKRLFSGVKKSKGLSDVTDAYFLSKYRRV